jgi:chromosomal replication initiator protein
LTPKSLPEIGRRFGGRDHTTVLYGIRQVKRRIETDAEVAADVAILRAKLCPEVPAE